MKDKDRVSSLKTADVENANGSDEENDNDYEELESALKKFYFLRSLVLQLLLSIRHKHSQL